MLKYKNKTTLEITKCIIYLATHRLSQLTTIRQASETCTCLSNYWVRALETGMEFDQELHKCNVFDILNQNLQCFLVCPQHVGLLYCSVEFLNGFNVNYYYNNSLRFANDFPNPFINFIF